MRALVLVLALSACATVPPDASPEARQAALEQNRAMAGLAIGALVLVALVAVAAALPAEEDEGHYHYHDHDDYY